MALENPMQDEAPVQTSNLIAVVLLAAIASSLGSQASWTQRYPVTTPDELDPGGQALVYDSHRRCSVLVGSAAQVIQTWEWDGVEWSRKTPALAPVLALGFQACYQEGIERVVLFGGRRPDVTYSAETWTWDGASWELESLATSPPARSNAAMVFDSERGRVVLFGGSDDFAVFDDTWEFDGASWQLRTPQNRPPALRGHAMAYDTAHRDAVLFGGNPQGSNNPISETWIWDGNDWSMARPANRPEARAGHTMTYDAFRERVVLFGKGGADIFTWEWDGSNWSMIFTSPPPPRYNHAATYDSARGKLTLFGGEGSFGRLRDTWEYFGTAPASYAVFGSGCPGSVGTPSLAAAQGQLPWVGETFTVEMNSLPPSPLSAPFGILGFSRETWSGLPLPLDLSVIGMFGCDLLASLEATFPLANASGSSTWSFRVPANPSLAGGRFYQQGLVLDPGTNPFGAIVTNGAEATIGIR